MAEQTKAPGVPIDSILCKCCFFGLKKCYQAADQFQQFFFLDYKPLFGVNILFGILFELAAIFLFINLFRHRDRWGLCLPIGAFFQGLGFFLRVPLINMSNNIGLYIVADLCIVLSPACYFAFNYIWFGRLTQRVEEKIRFQKNRNHITFVQPSKFGRFFIISDILTFLIQGSGGSLQIQESGRQAGRIIFLIGIIAQFASYVFFVMLSVPIAHSLKQIQPGSEHFYTKKRIKELLCVLYFSSFWIIVSIYETYLWQDQSLTSLHSIITIQVRSIYRTIELVQGFGGYLARNEGMYRSIEGILDTL